MTAPKSRLSIVALLPWILLGFFGVAALGIIARDPLEIGPDENMEFSKMLLAQTHPADLAKAWNDQPWFYSVVFGNLFRWTGFAAAIPRLFSALCAFVFCAGLRRFMPRGAGPWHHALGILLFLTFPHIQDTTVSAMLELPATLLALIGASALFDPPAAIANGNRSKPAAWIGGGAVVGLAIAIKLTALMVVGAAALALALSSRNRADLKDSVRRYAVWTAAAVVVFLIAIWYSPSFDFSLLWSNHANAAAHIPAAEFEKVGFSVLDIFQGATAVGFFAGAIQLARRRAAGVWLLPASFGVVAVLVHLVHRPFWYYYYVHLAGAFAPIAGWFIVELASTSLKELFGRERELSPRTVPAVMTWTALLSLWVAADCSHAREAVAAMFHRERTRDNKIVNLLRAVSPQVNWAFSTSSIYTARAGLPTIPDLTVVPRKRVWTGYKREELAATVARSRPEVLILPPLHKEQESSWQPPLHDLLQPLLQSSYQLVLETADVEVYFSKSVNAPVMESTRQRLDRFGL